MATAVTVGPLLRNLHSDPRFQALLAKMKLDDWKRKVLPMDIGQLHQSGVDHGIIALARGCVRTHDATIELMAKKPPFVM